MSEAFQPISERAITFREREIATAVLKDGQGYVAFNSLCDAFGLDRKGQRQRLTRQGSYYEPYTTTIVMSTKGGPQSTLCLQASAVPVFLAGVSIEHVKDEESRELLRAFLEEVHVVLAEHFGISERGEIQFLRGSIARQVAEQEAYEERLLKKVDEELAAMREAHEEKVQQIREAFAGLREDVRRIERVAGPKARITPEQRGQIRETVATLGQLLIEEKGIAKPYPGIYIDITRMTGVSKVEDIQQEDFERVVEFLNRQIKALTIGKGKEQT
jgi:Xaa-Pro aminopeptidase